MDKLFRVSHDLSNSIHPSSAMIKRVVHTTMRARDGGGMVKADPGWLRQSNQKERQTKRFKDLPLPDREVKLLIRDSGMKVRPEASEVAKSWAKRGPYGEKVTEDFVPSAAVRGSGRWDAQLDFEARVFHRFCQPEELRQAVLEIRSVGADTEKALEIVKRIETERALPLEPVVPYEEPAYLELMGGKPAPPNLSEKPMPPDTTVFNAVLACHWQAKDWEGALKVLKNMRQRAGKASPNNLSYHIVCDALLRAGQSEKAFEMYAQGVRRGVVKHWSRDQGGLHMIDLHGYTAGFAKLAVRFVLEDSADCLEFEDDFSRAGDSRTHKAKEDLLICTGQGTRKLQKTIADYLLKESYPPCRVEIMGEGGILCVYGKDVYRWCVNKHERLDDIVA